MAKNTKNVKTIVKGDDIGSAPKKTRTTAGAAGKKPRAKAKVAGEVKKTDEIKAEVKDVADDVSEKLKAELEEIIAENIESAPVDSVWNKLYRNGVIAIAVVVIGLVVWNFLT